MASAMLAWSPMTSIQLPTTTVVSLVRGGSAPETAFQCLALMSETHLSEKTVSPCSPPEVLL
jgi:hypothetical protein